MRLPQREIRRARIEIVPMIDTMIFLLIFFMMASLAMTPMTSLKVDLPKAASGEKTNATRVLLTMTAGGDLYLNRDRVTLAEVTRRLRERIAADPETQVIINADRGLKHGQVIALLDAARQADPKVLSVATEPNPEMR